MHMCVCVCVCVCAEHVHTHVYHMYSMPLLMLWHTIMFNADLMSQAFNLIWITLNMTLTIHDSGHVHRHIYSLLHRHYKELNHAARWPDCWR